jgi:opacity protein-like surface antigen
MCFYTFKILTKGVCGMNKVIAVVVAVLALGTFSTTSAVNMKWGLDLSYEGGFGGGALGGTAELRSGSYWQNVSRKAPWSGLGINFFFDATYAEIDLNSIFGSMTESRTTEGNVLSSGTEEETTPYSSFNIGVFGKYPVALQDNINLWPTLGIDYSFVGVKLQEDGDCNALWIKFGAGADYAWKENMFLRAKILYGIRTGTKAEDNFDKGMFNHGLTIGVGVGWYIRARESSKSSGGNDFD